MLDAPFEGAEAECRIDWRRRFDHMQQHTGQHLLSAVLLDVFDVQTVSFHMGGESSTIDIARSALDLGEARAVIERANDIVFENRSVSIAFAESSEDLGLRKATAREGLVRIVSIAGLDRSACGGTHVRATGEIGPILIRKIEKVRGNVRLEFICGMRAVRRSHADYEALAHIGRTFSSAVDETPALARSQVERLQEAEKARRKLALELAQARGRQLYSETQPDSEGQRRVTRLAEAMTDELRAEAQAFAAGAKAVFICVAREPPSALIAASGDSGVNAGQLVKSAVTSMGGRGGGSGSMAQGSVPSRDLLDEVLRSLTNPAGK